MAAPQYQMTVEFSPPAPRPGQQATVTVRLSAVQGEIRSVHLAVPEHDIYETLTPQPDGSFRLTSTIPWEAPAGTYQVRFYARSPQGEKGPDVVVPLQVA